MKILFTSEAVVEECNGILYKTSFTPFVKRYKYFGDLTFASYKKEVDLSKQSPLDTQDVKFEFFIKENTLKNLIFCHKKNKRHMENCVKNADIVVAHLPSSIGQMAVKYAKKYKKPYFIGVVGCAWDAYWNYNWKGKVMAPFLFLQMRHTIKKAEYVFYVTQLFLQKRYPSTGVNIGCSNVEINQPSNAILENRLKRIETFDIKGRINIATTAAVNVRYKGQEYVIRALNVLNRQLGYNFHYYPIGGGDNTFLANIVKELNLGEYVHFTGPVPHEQIMDELDKMDIYIHPSKQEGLPRALIEAMSRALPAFGSITAGIPELLASDCLFKNGDVNQIIAYLSSLTKEKMMEYAIRDFEKSSEYTSDVLNERRRKFFDSILKDINNACRY